MFFMARGETKRAPAPFPLPKVHMYGLTRVGRKPNSKSMDTPEVNTTITAEPRWAPDEIATAFFPDFATVRAALEAGKIGVWSWDIGTSAVTWSSNMEAIHGLPPGSFDGTYAFFERDIHEDDRARVAEAVHETLRTGRLY
jgi:PAS domain-containing protein